MAAAGPQSAGTRLLQEIRAYCASVPGEVCDLCLMISEVTWPQRPRNAAHSWIESLYCCCCSKETPCFRFKVRFFLSFGCDSPCLTLQNFEMSFAGSILRAFHFWRSTRLWSYSFWMPRRPSIMWVHLCLFTHRSTWRSHFSPL